MQGTCCHVRRDQCRGPIIEAADLGVSESYWRLGPVVYHCQSVKEVGRDNKKKGRWVMGIHLTKH